MKKGEIYNGIVERIDYPNKGIVRIEGVADSAATQSATTHSAVAEGGGEPVRVRIKRVLPGERISLRLKKKRRGIWEGEKLESLEPGPDACEPICPHAADCGGCAYQGLAYEAQTALKEQQVLNVLSKALNADQTEEHERMQHDPADDGSTNILSSIWEGIHASPAETDYRNKMEFTFGDAYKGGPLALGLHKRGAFHDIVTADGCRICDPDFSEIVRVTRDYFEEKQIPFYHRMRHDGYLRHLLVRKGHHTGEILIDLVTAGSGDSASECSESTDNKSDIEETNKCTKQAYKHEFGKREELLTGWVDAVQALESQGHLEGRIVGILHTKNDRLGDVIEDQGTDVLFGEDHFTDQVLGLDFAITPFSFFQTNTAGAEVLYGIVRDYLGDVTGKRVYDLYSGTGTIAQILAPAADEVIGVEIVPEAVEAARDNAAHNGLSNCRFLCGDVFEVLDSQTDAGEAPDVIVLDPPREGVRPQALKKILGYGAERIVYVSCQITSLARDLPVITEAGYHLQRATSVDMFPYTTGVETVVLLRGEKLTDI